MCESVRMLQGELLKVHCRGTEVAKERTVRSVPARVELERKEDSRS